MEELRYMISDASKKIDVEPHVLRYWEEELEVEIPRNEMGHRYYRDKEIELFKNIRELKEQGFQLKAIKMLLPDINRVENLDPQSILKLREELNERAFELEKREGMIESQDGTKIIMEPRRTSLEWDEAAKEAMIHRAKEEQEIQMKEKMIQFKLIMSNLILDVLRENNETVTRSVSASVSEKVIKEMDYLLRVKAEKEEERYKKFDETMREYQKSRLEMATGKEKPPKKKRRFFHKKQQ